MNANVDIWRIALPILGAEGNGRLAACEPILASDERERAARFVRAQSRADFIITRGTVRVILARYLDCDPRQIAFTLGPQGKPAVRGAAIHFNIAHTAGLAVLAAGWQCEVGVDIERLRPVHDATEIAARFFSARDAQVIRETPASERSALFLKHWTMREALLKLTGKGIADLSGTEQFSLHEAIASGEAGFAFQTAKSCLRSWRPAPNYAGALAVESSGLTIVDRVFAEEEWRVE